MSDARLRELERDALAAGDSESWKAYYRERVRLGMGLPSGTKRWRVDLPEGSRVQNLVFNRDRTPKNIDEEREIELEWRRCGTGLGVSVSAVTPTVPTATFNWRECLHVKNYRTAIPQEVMSAFVTVLGDNMVDRLGAELYALSSQGLVPPLFVTAPEFLGDPYVMAGVPHRAPSDPTLVQDRGRGVIVNPDVTHLNPFWAKGMPC